jgi:diguanylate cyclase (GGDEF)-like protein
LSRLWNDHSLFGGSRLSLKARLILFALPTSALLAFVIGFSMSSVATRLFLHEHLQARLSLARSIARGIDGDAHGRFTSYAATSDPVYRAYIRTLSGIFADEKGITYLYTLGYDAAADRLFYVLDAQIATADMIWVETDRFAFSVTFDEAGHALLDIDQSVHRDQASVTLEGRRVAIAVRQAAGGPRELAVDGVPIASFVSVDPLVVETPSGRLDRGRRSVTADLALPGGRATAHYSFVGRGDAQSDPGSEFVDTPEIVAHVKGVIRAGRDYVEPEAQRDVYGESVSAYGIIRGGNGAPVGAVMVDVYSGEIRSFRRSLGLVIYPVSALAFALALAGLVALSQLVSRPLRAMSRAVAAVAAGDLSTRIELERGDEIGALARGFNGMVAALARHIEELRRTEERLATLAFRDEMTGLLNRKSFYDHLAEALNLARRSEHEGLRGLLFLDLDHFKDINDTLGHDFGDRLLREVAQRLKAQVRESDHVFRLGGDEFTVILNSLSRETDAAIVAQKLLDSLEEPFTIQDNRLHIGTSIGIAIHPMDGETVEQLVKSADTALFDAKRERHAFRHFTRDMQDRALAKIGMMSRLLRALETGSLALELQPQVDGSGRVVGVEALLRWTDGERGPVPPDAFVPLAEETGAILPIGKWVLGAACLEARALRARGFDNIPVFVNMSAREFLSRDVLATIQDALRATGIPPSAIGLEIAEPAFGHEAQVAERLAELVRLGIPLVVDHFGTGSSSLVRLESLPVSAVKIDRRFAATVERGGAGAEIIKAIAALSFAAGRRVTAVGVESEEQATLLRSLGCEVLQGFALCRPLSGEALAAWLQGRQRVGR